MAKSSIEWTDATWNPVTGCTRVSAGCDNCYAVKMTKRLEAMGQAKYSGHINPGKDHFNGVVKCHDDVLVRPLTWKHPKRIFVNSMSDLFHKEVPFEFIDKVFAVMALCPQHTFQILTKRPERMAEYFANPLRHESIALAVADILSDHFESAVSKAKPGRVEIAFDARTYSDNYAAGLRVRPLPNVWLGTSVEDQKTADERISHLLNCPAVIRFLSCEPLLGDLNLLALHNNASLAEGQTWVDSLNGRAYAFESGRMIECKGIPKIHWVICGGESGEGARPMHPDWARSLRDQCQAAGVPFFFKQWGEWVTEEQSPEDIVLPGESTCFFAVPKNKDDRAYLGGDQTGFYKVGKHRAGRELDGVEHNEFPEVQS